MIINIDYKLCYNCLDCLDICPMDLFRFVDNHVVAKYPDKCVFCMMCVDVCSANAIKITQI